MLECSIWAHCFYEWQQGLHPFVERCPLGDPAVFSSRLGKLPISAVRLEIHMQTIGELLPRWLVAFIEDLKLGTVLRRLEDLKTIPGY